MTHRVFKDCAILIGYDPNGRCVYSAQMALSDYWDGEHVWDTNVGVKSLHLERIHGYLFDESGDLLQEFESIFDIARGVYKSGWQKHSDGAFQEDST